MTVSITEFVRARLDEDEAAATEAGGDEWTSDVNVWMVIDSKGDPVAYDEGKPTEEQAAHIARYDPARALREVTAKRRVLERHCADTPPDSQYCRGCPGDRDGYPDTELNDCPELQDIAYIWNDHSDWNPKWCPHAEGRHEADVTELPPARRAYTNACNRCGQGDGWHYRNRRTT